MLALRLTLIGLMVGCGHVAPDADAGVEAGWDPHGKLGQCCSQSSGFSTRVNGTCDLGVQRCGADELCGYDRDCPVVVDGGCLFDAGRVWGCCVYRGALNDGTIIASPDGGTIDPDPGCWPTP